ncbi:MAG: phytanoyl-CoA dioxygenase [Dehalococcoidia bacterium]|nr:phytanoyl-CoA dioxygenase [Dehalococcoidia bacterium]
MDGESQRFQARSYAEQGFLVLRQAVSQQALGTVRAAVEASCVRYRMGDERCVANGYSIGQVTKAHPERNPGVDPADVRNEPFLLGNLAALDPRFIRFLSFRPLWDIAAAMLGRPESEIVYRFAQVLRRPAGVGPGQSWHRDFPNPYVQTESAAHFLRLLVPMHPMSSANAGTGVLAGSHLVSDGDATAGKATEHPPAGAQFPSLDPGDVLVIHPKLIHGGGPNRGAGDRDLAVIQFGWSQAPLTHCAEGERLSLATREAMRRGERPQPPD